ncbi:MAG TPA: hypothetical protein VH817_00160 [Thermoleophilaceae bacterium]
MSLVELPLTLPPMFAEACGYQGEARHIALCWIPELGELWWSDNGQATLGDSRAFLMLCGHPATSDALKDYQREAASEGDERPWLLVDRDRRRLSMGPHERIWRMVEAQPNGRRLGRRPRLDRYRQRQLEHIVSSWLDWMGRRNGRA